MIKKIIDWLDERIEVRAMFKSIADKQIPGGASWWYVLGSSLLAVFALQVVSGIFLTFYYVPTPDHAHASVKYIQEQAAFGNIIRGMHHWGSTFMVILVGLHMLRVIIFGSYKKPREIVWLSGVGLLLVVTLFAFTGYLLPWDQKAYWATVVGTNVAANVPVIGGFLVRIARGGAELGALTLSRFFAVHTYILPSLLAIFAIAHVFFIEKIGASGHYDAKRNAEKKSEPLFPHQVFKDTVFFFLIFVGLIALAKYWPAPLEGQADPTDSSYIPRPEWYFYFLFQLLKYFEGKMEIVGAVILPGVFFTGLILLPFLDKSPIRNPFKRPKTMFITFAGLVVFVALTLMVAMEPRPGHIELTETEKAGKAIFEARSCSGCHTISGKGGHVGPDLTQVGTRRDAAFLDTFLKNPQSMNAKNVMPKPELTDEQRQALIEFLLKLK